ncbi:MAG: peptidoglycan-binding protein [Chthoniobacterales bacterium]
MKKSLFLALAFALSLSQPARADDNHHTRNRARTVPAQTQSTQVPTARQQTARNVPQQRAQRSNPAYPPHRISTATRTAPQRSVNTSRIYNRPVVHRTTTPSNRFNAQNDRFRDRSRENNAHVNNNVAVQRARSNRHPRSNRPVDRNSYNNARHRWVHTRHDRGWWRSHYNTTFLLFGGGYYYWDAGYWFPAYGYDPYYNNYIYDEPIYGYNNLAPGDVLENVQIALRDEGYYNGPIDGLIGPQTREALAAYQRDHGLIITEAVDEPTLAELGLT